MMRGNPYTISRPVPYQTDPEFDHAVTFAVDKRDNALVPVLNASGSYVRTVSNEPLSDWEMVFETAATSVLSGVPGVPSVMLQGARLRSSLRGEGRDRWR
jgi:hypothetical protein